MASTTTAATAARPPRLRIADRRLGAQVRWLASGLVLAFAVPFVLADTLEIQRDVYYGIYAAAVALFFLTWARESGPPARRLLVRNWKPALVLTMLAAAATVAVAFREDAADRPGGLELLGAIMWRGVVYGLADGVLLSAFPILAVFAAFGSRPLRERSRRVVAGIGALALAASLLFTAVYHLGYSDFRSSKVAKPMAGDVVWSAPTLLTLSPVGAPIAHAALHVSAVVHTYDSDLFLPPHGD